MKINSENNNSAVLMELGARIKRNRIDMQLSQQDFAAKAGISTRTLSAAENGEDIRLSSRKRTDITENDVFACASVMDITRSKCKSMIERVRLAVSDFPKFAEQAKLLDATIKNVQQLIKQK